MRGSSLATRLFLSATAWVVVILVITGVVLSSVYRNATERAFDRRLNLYLRTLIAEVATPDEPPDHQFQSLGEPLFELPLSGWYWQIVRTDEKAETRASRSLWDKKLPKLEEIGAELTAAGIRLGYVDGPEGQSLRVVERPVDLGADGKFLVSVAGDASEIFDEIRAFDYYLGGTFAALGIVLLLTTIFQVRFGLAPLKRISESIADIRSGRAERLEGEFPVEIAPLARETNALIDANREIVERARTHVGNLAHAIKTPLSVIVNEASAHAVDPFASKVLEQADVMRDQVAHHLERARIAARVTIVGTVTEVAPAIEALRRTMEKIHRDRGITIAVKADPRAKFRGERQDLEEMAGNLVDNACKWAASQVLIEVLVEPPAEPGAGPRLRIMVDDDGRGLSAAERAQVSRRGQRLDESKPGSGLGLSIVVDLAALYGGSLVAGRRPDRRLAGGTGAAGGVNVPSGRLPGVAWAEPAMPGVDFAIPKRLLNARTSNDWGRALCRPHDTHIHTRRMSQTSTERLRDYLAQLPPQSQALLMREFERAIERGEDMVVANFVLEQLRKVVRGTEEDDEARPRTDDPARLLYGPLEPFLVEGNFPVRTGQIRRASLLPVWQWLSRDGAPEAARAFEAALAEVRQTGSTAGLESATRKFQLAAADAIVKIATPVAGDDRQRSLARIGPPNVVEDLLSIGGVLRAREALDTLGSRIPSQMRVFSEAQIASVASALNVPSLQTPQLLPFALSLIMQRLAQPWQIIRLAIKMAASDDELRVAATPYGVAVTIALHDLSFLAACLRTDIRRGHFDNVGDH